jgi:rod shape-determining protein MreC
VTAPARPGSRRRLGSSRFAAGNLNPGARSLTRRQRRAAAALIIVALLFLSLDIATAPFRDARSGASGVLGSLARGTDSVVGPVRRFVQGLPHVSGNQDKIDSLTEQNAQLRKEISRDQVDTATASELAALQLQATATGVAVLPARVIGTGPGQGFEWTVMIDAGRDSGIQVGQTVVAGASLIGRVIEVRGATSTVLLIADAGSGVGVRDQRNGQLGVLSGAGVQQLTLAPLDPGADLKVGDQLLSGPAGQSTYVAGLPVATITAVSTAASGAIVATAQAISSLTSLDLVGILLAAPPAADASGSAAAGSSRAPLQPGGG